MPALQVIKAVLIGQHMCQTLTLNIEYNADCTSAELNLQHINNVIV